MLIVAVVMAVIGLAALVTAVVTSNEVIAWVCIAAAAIGVVLLIVDAMRERHARDALPPEEPPRPSEDYEPDMEALEGEEASYEEPSYDVDYPDDNRQP